MACLIQPQRKRHKSEMMKISACDHNFSDFVMGPERARGARWGTARSIHELTFMSRFQNFQQNFSIFSQSV